MIVVDSSTIINYIRNKKTPSTMKLAQLEASLTGFYIPNICIQEVLQGAKNEKEWSLLKSYFLGQLALEPKDPLHTYVRAAKIYFDLRRKGKTVRSTQDCLIAEMVIENKGILLHEDKDFDVISTVRKISFF